jgi:hypothetical protein
LPEAQLVHFAAPASEKRPGVHDVQLERSTSKVPAAQILQVNSEVFS